MSSDIIWFHPGPFPVKVGFTRKRKAFNRFTKKHYNTVLDYNWDVNGAATHWFPSYNTVIITLPADSVVKGNAIIALLAHEVVHVVQAIAEFVSAPNGHFDVETEAHMVQYYLQCVLDAA